MKYYRFLLALFVLISPGSIHVATAQNCGDYQLDLALANAHDGDTIQLDCSTTITIRSTKAITKSITLEGTGFTLLGSIRPMFVVTANAKATIDHLEFNGGSSEDAIIQNNGTLTVNNSTFTGVAGFGILNNANSRLDIMNSTFINNLNGMLERGIYGYKAIMNVTNTLFTGNEHALINLNGTLSVAYTTFANNHGTGIFNNSKATVIGSTFTGNNHGIDNDSGDVLVANSTFAANHTVTPQGIGAGIANRGTVKVINSTFSDNIADGGGAIGSHFGGTVSVENTIIANSALGRNCFGPIIDAGHNLQYPGTGCGTSISSADPKLLPLADNGGFTQTMALAPDSPASAAGKLNTCSIFPVAGLDQRGLPRLTATHTACAIGAFEDGISLVMIVLS